MIQFDQSSRARARTFLHPISPNPPHTSAVHVPTATHVGAAGSLPAEVALDVGPLHFTQGVKACLQVGWDARHLARKPRIQ